MLVQCQVGRVILPPGFRLFRELTLLERSISAVSANETVAPLSLVAGAHIVRVDLPSGDISTFEPQRTPGWEDLHPLEQEFALGKPPRRCVEFVGGRVALRSALRACGWTGELALMPLPQGGPALPIGFTGSISHKAAMALAVAAPSVAERTLGIDSEVVGDRERLTIARKVLRPLELARWESGGGSWTRLLEIFSTKEAIYKALHPHLRRYVGFEEAEVLDNGSIELHLREDEGPFGVRSQAVWEGERLVVVVEVAP